MPKRKTIMLLVTYGCNLRCTYCYEPKTAHRKMTLEQAQRYVREQMEALDSTYEEVEVQLMGGEPLMMFPLLRDLAEWLWQQAWPLPLAQVFAPTNGTLLTPEMKAWFTEHRERVCLGLSFDGNRLMQNVNRSGSAAQVDLGFFAKTWPRQSVKMTLSPDTLPHLYDGVMFLYGQGLHYVTVDLAMGDAIVWTPQHLALLAQQLQRLADYYVEHPAQPRISMLNQDVLAVLRKSDQVKKCSCGEQLVCVDCDGQAYACHLFAPIASPAERAAASRSIDFTRHADFKSAACGNCLLYPLCTTCYGMNYKLTGSLTQQSPFTCQAFKVQFLTACDLQQRLASQAGNTQQAEKIRQIVSQF